MEEIREDVRAYLQVLADRFESDNAEQRIEDFLTRYLVMLPDYIHSPLLRLGAHKDAMDKITSETEQARIQQKRAS